MDRTRKSVTIGLGVGLVCFALVSLYVLRATRPIPAQVAAFVSLPRVETLTIQPTVFDSPIVGYGTVRPKRQVKIVPEVGGRLTQVHRDLAVGNIITKGELLFEIEPRVYDSKVRQVEAELSRLTIQLERHQKDEASLRERLALAESMESLSKSAAERERGLVKQQSGTAPEVERAEERYLGHREAVLTYKSQLELIPLQIQETDALLATKRAQLDEAKLNVERTRIFCPFDARVDAVTAQESQVVIASFQIATLTDMEALEVPVVIDPRDLRWTESDAFKSAIGADVESAPEARITWTLQGQEYSWNARVTRLEKLDEVTRTAHVVVEIRDILRGIEKSNAESRPPLSAGMFCRAELPTQPLADALVIPRHALRDGECVYVFVPDAGDPGHGRLALKRVPSLRQAGESIVVAFRATTGSGGVAQTAAAPIPCELLPGDEVVVSALPKAVEGMRLARRAAATAGRPAAMNAPLLAGRVSPSQPDTALLLGSLAGVR